MGYIEGENRRQNLLFPESLEEYVEKENPVRLFDAFVETLDFKNLEFERETPRAEGRPGYNPRDLMKHEALHIQLLLQASFLTADGPGGTKFRAQRGMSRADGEARI